MFSGEDKSLVGENCPQYVSRNILQGTNVSNLARNCINCTNYLDSKCSINLFSGIYEKLKIN